MPKLTVPVSQELMDKLKKVPEIFDMPGGFNQSEFVRNAISEKIQRMYDERKGGRRDGTRLLPSNR
jgi:hypothetical protein